MPVPKPKVAAQPRQLLRDVVYQQLRTAILKGTLEPGERLNDDELTAWLGVSRTPVREAIARLASEGLVEMAANRYTRVSSLSGLAHAEAAALLAALQQLALAHAEDAPQRVRSAAHTTAEGLADRIIEQDLAAYRQVNDAAGALVAGLGNGLLTDTEIAARSRVSFHAAADDAAIDWGAAGTLAAAVSRL
ncbi:GntR family transcriptional regulator [Curtobacterium sp. TXMA1]|uniref:GntR family transcriptional regulator n=1 Tax=Curtobacterium sp. TXMA1 TaxID=2876939 RepID=UPI001CCB5EDD|nr:GntR family transcriptional regulator [Curtobacterium sp. TXMA1]UBQ02568.1 GntR family transcriptional regulator [Curtobacterium sp. TXMA1]